MTPVTRLWAILLALALATPVAAEEPGLLFRLGAARGFAADYAQGDPAPNFADKVALKSDPAIGPYVEAADDQILSWNAPGNIYAQRGTVSFAWRARTPLGRTQFPIFRVGYADHTSWDMTWLRIDWNGQGFDAFVTDNGLSRVRVSWTIPEVPRPDQWVRIAFAWDEATGVALYVDGRKVAEKKQAAVLDAGLDQFGPHSRVISPYQVQSAYQFVRGGDIADLRIHDHAREPSGAAAGMKAWRARYGWTGEAPPYLDAPATRIRKVEFADVRDIRQRMTAGSDGIPETTWPGVYNRSRLAGRHDYFELPDWNTYIEGGRAVTFTLPDEAWNRIEITGAADGRLAAGDEVRKRASGVQRNWYALPARRGGAVRFENARPETPIQEFAVYNVEPGAEPDGYTLSYAVRPGVDPAAYPTLDALIAWIAGRHPAEEQAIAVALPAGAPSTAREPAPGAMPIVHIFVPADFRLARPGRAVGRFSYGWENLDLGLDGIALDIPALPGKGLIPLNIRVKDPLWPGRDMLDVSVSVKAGEGRTVFLDTRDRMLPPAASLYLAIAAPEDLGARALEGMAVRLKFKPRAAALAEHVADRLAQASDNMAFVVEEHTNTRRLARFERLDRELTDLLRVDPANRHGREIWAELNPEQPWPAVTVPTPPPGVPAWAFLQVEDLKRVRQFIGWWIDDRQAATGDFGGGISDDDDLTQQWPPLALMGVEPDKVTASLNAMIEAAFRNGVITDGLGTIRTDDLHAYEEAINAESQGHYLNFGDPRTLERLMATARAYPRIIQANAAGHTHVISSYYSATEVVRESPWSWSRLYSYLILHPGLLVVDYNGDPKTKAMIVALADGHLAHGKVGADGRLRIPEEINADTEADRFPMSTTSRGHAAVMQLFWAAWRWSGDPKYLRPLEAEIAAGSFNGLAEINSPAIDILGRREALGPQLVKAAEAGRGGAYARYEAWRTTGDLKWLEAIYRAEIETAERRMWMVTEGHWWTDRVELNSDILQRTRLGGMALRRNQFMPGHLVSWRFDQPRAAEEVGILVEGTPKAFKVTAHNLSTRAIAAKMTGWDVAAGRWRVTPSDGAARDVAFERSVGLDLVFPPGRTVTWELVATTVADAPSSRADLGIGPADVKRTRGGLDVTVHSLGAQPTPAATVTLYDRAGKAVTTAPVPPLAAPSDLQPKTARVVLKGAGVRVAVEAAGLAEITSANNAVTLP